jgi:proline iminopeptidase
MDSIFLAFIAFAFISNSSCASRTLARVGKSDLEVREGMKSINGTKLFVRDVGPSQAPVIIAVHGGPGGSYLGMLPLERLAPAFRIIFYDQRGTGKSERLKISARDQAGLEELSLEKNVEDIEELRKSIGSDKVSVIGHSNGGALATFYAAKYPRHIEKLVVYSGGPEDTELAERKRQKHLSKMPESQKLLLKQYTDSLQERVEQNASQDELDELFTRVVGLMIPYLYYSPPKSPVETGRLGFWANMGVAKYIDSFDRKAFASHLAKIKSPTLLIWGRFEPAPQERLLYLRDNIPNAQLVVFEKSSHNAMKEETDLFFRTLLEFMTDKSKVEMKTSSH